jgi:ubiquitin carboxyl-terminal hydrolase 7
VSGLYTKSHTLLKAVYKIPTEDETYANSALTLQRLFYRLQTVNDAVPTLELTKSFGWETQDIFAQQDVQELNRILMENLENKMKGTEVENLLNKMFVGKTRTYIKCIDVDYGSERIEEFWDIQLNVRGYINLDESFKDYIAEETMNGENKYFAEGHGLQDATKGVIFESFPDVLHLHLKRFEYDLNTYAMQKVAFPAPMFYSD